MSDGTQVAPATVMRVVELEKSYGGLRAVDAVSFDVRRTPQETLTRESQR